MAKILQVRRSLVFMLLLYLLPMMLTVAAVEGFGLVQWGKPAAVNHRIHKFSVGKAVAFETVRLVATTAIVVICAVLIKMFAQTFGKRHTYQQAFTLVVYGLSPLFLFRLLDAAPGLSPWVTWGVGIIFCMGTLYQGVPRVLDPDPPNAFGLFFMSSLVFFATTGLERFVTAWYLEGRMRPVHEIIAGCFRQLSL